MRGREGVEIRGRDEKERRGNFGDFGEINLVIVVSGPPVFDCGMILHLHYGRQSSTVE